MTRQLLDIRSSGRTRASHGNQTADVFVNALQAAGPAWRHVARDVVRDPVPFLDEALVEAIRTRHEHLNPHQHELMALSDALIAEVKAADALLIATGMYNWGIPAALKAWLDQIMRVGMTFDYGANGAQGLLGGKPCLVVIASGAIYDTERKPMDHVQPYLQDALSVIGLKPEFVRVDGTLMGHAVSGPREAAAHAALHRIAQSWQNGVGHCDDEAQIDLNVS